METLVVLSALVCTIIAAPALPGQDFQDITSTTWSPLITLIREKKSPQQSTDFDTFSDIATSSGQDLDSSLPMGRSLAFKKPIIVKKKVGYHLYRDSDEEKALSTSRESCNERVKVKLCDEKILPNSMRMKSSTIEDINDHSMSEEEMKRSLVMVKEAIANLERDLNKTGVKHDMKLEKVKNDDLSIDETVHKDSDAARQALEHIHENFGNLESLSFHSTTSKDADELHDIHVTVSKSEEDRIAKWKEAIENIQKNVDIARNIEDSFRSPTRSLSIEEFGNTDNNNIETHEENNVNKLRNKDEVQSTTEHAMEEDMQCSSQIIKIRPKGKDAKENDSLEDDMSASATNVNEPKIEFIDRTFMRSDHPENTHNDQTSQFSKILPHENMNTRNSEFDLAKTDQSDTTFAHDQSMNMKTAEDKFIKEKLISNNNFETDMDTAGLNNEMKSTDLRSDLNELQNEDELANSATITDNLNNSDIKFNDKIGNRFAMEQRNTQKSTKLEEQLQQDEELTETIPMINKKIDNTDSKAKFVDNLNQNHFQGKNQQIDNFVKEGDQTIDREQQSFTTAFKARQSEMTSPTTFSNTINTNPQQTSELFSMQRSPERMSNFDKAKLVKEAEEFNNQHELRKDTRFNNPTQLTGTRKASNSFDGMGPHIHLGHVEKHHEHMTQSMSLDDSRFRPIHHQHDHWNARAAYGPAVGPVSASTNSGTNTVGVFPNANVVDCSIPLLVSCAPSVISGNMAKALPAGYGASAYRTEDDFTFFPNKREIKKPNEIPSTTENRKSTRKLTTTISSDNKE